NRRMEYRKLGRTGLKVSELCLGTMTFLWTSDEPSSLAVLSAFTAAGGNFIDTADVYSRWAPGNPGGTAETLIGKWLQTAALSRESLVIATKCRGAMGAGPNDQGASRHHIIAALEASLRRLQTDYVDLYQIHSTDFDTRPDETLRALDDLTRMGKIRYAGASNYPAWWLMKSLWASDARNLVRFESIQPHYNLMVRAEFERELAAVVADQGLAVIPYSPLAGGYLTGKYAGGSSLEGTRASVSKRIQDYVASGRGAPILAALTEIATARGRSLTETALAWLLTNPLITAPIIGANTVEQLNASLSVVGYRLSEAEMKALNDASKWD
nr:aldo/keto reductase [Thermoflexales bacterium]